MKIAKKIAAVFSAALTIVPICINSFAADTQAVSEPIRVMCLGDSITDGFWYKGGYRIELCRLLEEGGYREKIDLVGPLSNGECYDTEHAGYTGWAVDSFTPDMNPAMDNRKGISTVVDDNLTAYPADLVLLQIGTNDILSFYELDGFETRMTNLANQILTHLESTGGTLYIATLTPMDANDTTYIKPELFDVETMDNYVAQCNQAIKNVVNNLKAQGKNVELADIASVVTKADLYDGVHPSQAGYEKMGAYWYNIVTAYADLKFAPAQTTTAETSQSAETSAKAAKGANADDENGLSAGAVAAICVVIVVLAAAVIIFIKKKK